MALAFTLEQLCNVIDPIKVEGNTSTPLSNIGALDSATEGDLAFLGNDKYHAQVAECNASAILVPADYTGSSPKENQAYIFVEKPSYTLALICGQIEAALWPKPPAGTHPTAVIAESAKIGKNVHIGPFCVIGEKATVGDGAVLDSHVSVGTAATVGENSHIESGVRICAYSQLGARVHVLPNAVIGADGFGFIPVDGKIEKIPQIGNVVIEDDVEIGAGTCI
ncbi:MAG: UDP-3-O-(3-hydroxymyristoyl)glucosamine N-acyltransferase, partial [Opitutales bacterium]|nr:UDP-3-O-(3-hydroxymyristoyl)glucosamine N-acyltransferase [Opitutales bacterium]